MRPFPSRGVEIAAALVAAAVGVATPLGIGDPTRGLVLAVVALTAAVGFRAARAAPSPVLAAVVVVLAVRVVTWAPRIHLHGGKAYALLDAPWTRAQPDQRYGDGWGAVMRVAGALLPSPRVAPDLVHVVQGAVSAAGPMLLGLAAARLGAGRAAAVGVGALGALHPWAIAVAPTEARSVLSATLAATALAALLGRSRSDGALAATALGLLAATSPLDLPLAALGAGVALAARRPFATAGAVLVGARAAAWGVFAAAGGDVDGTLPPALLRSVLAEHPWGRDAHVLLLDPTRSPAGLVPLAVIGAVWLAGRGRAGLLVVAAAALTVLTTLPVALVPDRIRHQLPLVGVVVLLAGVGALGPGPWRRLRALGGGLAIALTWGGATSAYAPPWVWQREHDLLRAALPHLRPDSVVRFVDVPGEPSDRGRWAERRGHGRWRYPGDALVPGELRWVGVADVRAGTVVPWDRLVPVVDEVVQAEWGGLWGTTRAAVRVGLYRVKDDPALSAPPPRTAPAGSAPSGG